MTSPWARSPPARRRLGEDVQRLERHRPVGLRVVVDVDAADVRLALVPVQPVDVELGRLVEVDRVLVDERLGREQVDLAEDARPVRRRVDDHDVLVRGGAERDLAEPGSSRCAQYQRPSPACRTWPSSPRNASRSSAGPGRSARPARTAARTPPPAGGRAARGGCPGRAVPPRAGRSSRYSGCWTTYWSTAPPPATRTDDAHALPPPGTAHLLPGRGDRARIAGEDRRRPAGRRPRPAPARWCSRRRGARRRAGRRSMARRSVGR